MQCSAGNGILTRGKRRKLHQQIFQIEGGGAGRHLYGTFLSESFYYLFLFSCVRTMFFFITTRDLQT
jgi:hypothetical protein